MNWKNATIEDLKKHSGRKCALENIPERIAALEAAFETVPAPGPDTVSVDGGKMPPDDRWINNIVERDRLQKNFEATKALVDLVERGLGMLSDEQRDILMDIVDRNNNYLENAESRSISVTTYYDRRDEALRRLTIYMYGIEEY